MVASLEIASTVSQAAIAFDQPEGIEMLEIRLLGQFDVRLSGQPITIQSRSAQSLLAYLVLTAGTRHRRRRTRSFLRRRI